MVDSVLTPYDALEALSSSPDIYGLILINFADLLHYGIEESLRTLFPCGVEQTNYTVVVYNANTCSDADMELLDLGGITDIMDEPYSLAALKVSSPFSKYYFNKPVYF
jgi:hypothetical protein